MQRIPSLIWDSTYRRNTDRTLVYRKRVTFRSKTTLLEMGWFDKMVTVCPNCGSNNVAFFDRFGKWMCGSRDAVFAKNSKDGCEEAPYFADVHEPIDPSRRAKVFLSYPHSSSWICIQIEQALKARGHDVWIDRDRIRYGDWRLKIAQGIKNSSSVLFLLTRDAICKKDGQRGVCLDELSIAVTTTGCVVNTVLLEPENVVKPTAAISHRQWLDMSEWKSKLNEGEPVFRAWFEEKIHEILTVVESDESKEFTGDIAEIHRRLPQAEWHMGREDLLREPLVGRGWLADEIDRWLDDPHGGATCAIYGGPGMGKSAFSVHFAQQSDRVTASLCFVHGNPSFNSPMTLVQSIAYQLAHRLTNYREELLRVLKETPVSHMHNKGEKELVELLIHKPLMYRAVDGGHEMLCVLVDGVDECESTGANAIIEVLRQLAKQLPRYIRLLIVSRPESNVIHALSPDQTIWLLGSDESNMRDVFAFLVEKLGESRGEGTPLIASKEDRAKVAETLARRSKGVMLYAKAICEAARKGAFDLHDEASFPMTLEGTFYGWFERIYPNERTYRESCRVPLGAIVGSPAPLPVAELEALLGLSENDSRDLLRPLRAFLVEGMDDLGSRTVAFSHKFLSDWLSDERSDRFSVSVSDSRRAMASGFFRLACDDPGSVSLFEARYGLSLMEEFGMRRELADCRRSESLALRMVELGDNLRVLRKFDDASVLYESAMSMEGVLGPIVLQDAKLKLAATYSFMSMERDDISLHRRALSLEKEVLAFAEGQGLHNNDLLFRARNSVGTSYRRLANTEWEIRESLDCLGTNYDEARAKAHDEWTRWDGIACNNYGSACLLYADKVNPAWAEELVASAYDALRMGVQIDEAVCGPNDIITLTCMMNLGLVLCRMGFLEFAGEVLQDSESRFVQGGFVRGNVRWLRNSFLIAQWHERLSDAKKDRGEITAAYDEMRSALSCHERVLEERRRFHAGRMDVRKSEEAVQRCQSSLSELEHAFPEGD